LEQALAPQSIDLPLDASELQAQPLPDPHEAPVELHEELPVPESQTLHGTESLSVLGVLDMSKAELKALPAIDVRPQEAHHVTGLPGKVQDIDDDIDAVDAVDVDLFPIFEEEALELLPQLAGEMRAWLGHPAEDRAANACMRTLHTFKGGARSAGAMRLGELAHRLETSIERLLARRCRRSRCRAARRARSTCSMPSSRPCARRTPAGLCRRDRRIPGHPQTRLFPRRLLRPSPLMEHVDLPVAEEPRAAAGHAAARSRAARAATRRVCVSTSTAMVPAAPLVAEREIDWSRFATSAPRQQTTVAAPPPARGRLRCASGRSFSTGWSTRRAK
jgi:chemosensory pili system protein ChpA (sensor histidine kinase/response regulator)